MRQLLTSWTHITMRLPKGIPKAAYGLSTNCARGSHRRYAVSRRCQDLVLDPARFNAEE